MNIHFSLSMENIKWMFTFHFSFEVKNGKWNTNTHFSFLLTMVKEKWMPIINCPVLFAIQNGINGTYTDPVLLVLSSTSSTVNWRRCRRVRVHFYFLRRAAYSQYLYGSHANGAVSSYRLSYASLRNWLVITLAASSRKGDVTVWRPSVRPSFCPSFSFNQNARHVLNVNHQRAACDAASVHLGQTTRRTDVHCVQ